MAKIKKQKLPKGQDDCMAISKQVMTKDYHAKLVIHDLEEMTKKQVSKLVMWLDEIGSQLISNKHSPIPPNKYAKTATWRLMK